MKRECIALALLATLSIPSYIGMKQFPVHTHRISRGDHAAIYKTNIFGEITMFTFGSNHHDPSLFRTCDQMKTDHVVFVQMYYADREGKYALSPSSTANIARCRSLEDTTRLLLQEPRRKRQK
ncbi:MAG: hypothetical protein OXR66_03215 [Candidatus Woesearchaeota archaeon]|nr:hypothetical protein [Candidatus Woesearchaeota archaeon]